MLGIVPNMESLRLVTAFIDTSMGTLGWHSPISTYDSARQIDVGVDASNNMIVAKFAHKISGDSNGCMVIRAPSFLVSMWMRVIIDIGQKFHFILLLFPILTGSLSDFLLRMHKKGKNNEKKIHRR